jgi:hypothetical protein
MRLWTCTLHTEEKPVTIGWANVARAPSFRTWLSRRMAAGYTYLILSDHVMRMVIYNNATKINLGVSANDIRLILREMGDYLLDGDVSIVHAIGLRHGRRNAVSTQDVLDHDTLEFAPERH